MHVRKADLNGLHEVDEVVDGEAICVAENIDNEGGTELCAVQRLFLYFPVKYGSLRHHRLLLLPSPSNGC